MSGENCFFLLLGAFFDILEAIYLHYSFLYMAGVNSKDTWESIEANDNYTPDNNAYSKLLRSYVSQKLNKKSERLSFAKKINNSESIPDSVLKELEKYKETQTEFRSLEINNDTLKVSDLKRELWWFLTSVHTKKQTLRDTFLREYDINSVEYTKNISSKIHDVDSEQELENLISSDIARDDFLSGIYKTKTPKRRLITNALQDLDIEDRIDNLEEHFKPEFYDTLEKFKRRQKLEREDIMSLFETGIITPTEKQHIIETFMPSITLSDAQRLWLVNEKKIRETKKLALETSLGKWFFGSINMDQYIDGIDNKDLIISTKGIFEWEKTQEKLFEENFFFEKFQQDFNALLEKIEADLAEKSIQTPKEMQEILSGAPNIHGIENFKTGSTLVIKQEHKNASGQTEEVTFFAEIMSLASAGTFIIQERGMGEYNSKSTKNSRQTYSDFIDFATKGNIPKSIEIITPELLGHKIDAGDIMDINRKNTFLDRSLLSADIKELTERKDKRKQELRKSGVPKSQWKHDKKLQEIYDIRAQKNKDLDDIESENKKTLGVLIDEVDPAGKKFETKVGTSFVTKWGNGDVFTIMDIDEINQVVTVKGLLDNEPISYGAFVDNFTSQKAKRVSKIDKFEELFNQTDDAYKTWQGFELKDNKVRNKSSKLKVDYDYLVPPKTSSNQELIKIHDINDTVATISFWEAKSNNSTSKDGEKKQGDVFATEKKQYTVSIGVLDHYVRESKLSFRSLEEGKIAEEEIGGIPKPEDKFGFANWFFQGMSFAAAIKWAETGIEQITNILNEGDDDKANQFALKMFGPFLWDDGKTDLQSRVESTQKKNMEEAIDRLKWINSKPATKLIKSWLEDPRTPQYKKEAGMFYMFEKYGALCAKELYPYQGQYFWYQKMWGIIGDKVWVETHEKNNRDPKQNTTEEQLVYNLMAAQVKQWGFNWVQRRSKLAKELKAKRGDWKKDEYETGLKDGENERSVQDRLDGALSEMSSGNYPNALGWLETVVNKWGTMKDMNMVPFVMVFSGMAYNFEKDILDKIKGFPSESRMLMMLRMMSYKPDMDLLNATIMEICKNLEQDPKYAGILPKAQKIFNNQSNRSMSELDKQEATIKFYEEYGEVLTNSLYMLNTGDTDDVHNKMIYLEKDNNSTFNSYYNLMEGYLNGDGSYTKNTELMEDSFAGAGTSWLDMYRAGMLFEMRTGWVLSYKDAANTMWKTEIVPEFRAITKRQYDSNDPVENERIQKKILAMNVRKFLSKLMSMHNDPATLSYFNSPTGWFVELNNWGIYFQDILKSNVSQDQIKYGNDDGLVSKFVDQIYDHETKWIDFSKVAVPNSTGRPKFIDKWEEVEEDQTVTVSDLIQWKAQNIIDTSKTPNTSTIANDNIEDPYDNLDQAG